MHALSTRANAGVTTTKSRDEHSVPPWFTVGPFTRTRKPRVTTMFSARLCSVRPLLCNTLMNDRNATLASPGAGTKARAEMSTTDRPAVRISATPATKASCIKPPLASTHDVVVGLTREVDEWCHPPKDASA